METQTVTYKVVLRAKQSDPLGYISYVFEDLEQKNPFRKYIMCVRFPNWEQVHFDIDEIGYVSVKYVREGVDQWYDGKDFVKYKNTNIIFLKFIPLKPRTDTSEIILD